MAKLRRKTKNFFLIFIFIILLIGLFGYRFVFIHDRFNKDDIKEFIEQKVEDPIKTYSAKLIATGDGLVHSPI